MGSGWNTREYWWEDTMCTRPRWKAVSQLAQDAVLAQSVCPGWRRAHDHMRCCRNVDNNFIQNSPQLETIQMSLHGRTDKQIKAYPHKRTLLSNRANAQETALARMGLRAVELCRRTLPAGFWQREARAKPGLISRGRKRSGRRPGQRWGGRGLTQKEHKGALEGDGNALRLNCARDPAAV